MVMEKYVEIAKSIKTLPNEKLEECLITAFLDTSLTDTGILFAIIYASRGESSQVLELIDRFNQNENYEPLVVALRRDLGETIRSNQIISDVADDALETIRAIRKEEKDGTD